MTQVSQRLFGPGVAREHVVTIGVDNRLPIIFGWKAPKHGTGRWRWNHFIGKAV
jgi:hypothetical protein